ncbi:MAG: transketolase family protein [Firmicutes bacterium]|jgi:transketolase|nr:transketolase family protein [Bacillota bacterium]
MARLECPRDAYGRALLEAATQDSRIVALDADLSGSTMSRYVKENFPDRFFEMGIAEQNMVSVAAGLSLTGKIPFAHSFSVFIVGRAYDQIRQSIAVPKLNVKLVGSSYGLSDFGDGATHQSVEDVAIMRAVPNMTVIVPVDAVEVRQAVKAILEYHGPVYLRISRSPMPVITDCRDEFVIGKPRLVSEGKDIVVYANGLMVSAALKAKEMLEEQGVSLRVINVSSIKPLDAEAVRQLAHGVKGIITAEEHSIIGGLGCAISDIIGEALPLRRVGIADRFGQSASSHGELLEHYGLTPESIVEQAQELLG